MAQTLTAAALAVAIGGLAVNFGPRPVHEDAPLEGSRHETLAFPDERGSFVPGFAAVFGHAMAAASAAPAVERSDSAPLGDPRLVPPGARLVFRTVERGAAIYALETARSPNDTRHWFARLGDDGTWRRRPAGGAGGSEDPLIFSRDGLQLLVALRPSAQGGTTIAMTVWK